MEKKKFLEKICGKKFLEKMKKIKNFCKKNIFRILIAATISMMIFAATENLAAEPILQKMSQNGNLPPGFSRELILDGKNLIGSFFEIENGGRADFLSNKKNPQYFPNGKVDFDAIKKDFERRGKKVVLIVAAAFLKSGTADKIEGFALEDGKVVGEKSPDFNLNGILQIENGIPQIKFLNKIFDTTFSAAKKNKFSLFKNISFLRPGGKFSSQNPREYELRFFVEFDGKKGVANFSKKMTYKKAVKILQKLGIKKAIGLDTGIVSEGYFFDKNGNEFLMVDENFDGGQNYTNLLVFYSP